MNTSTEGWTTLIPHRRPMCLIDDVERWSKQEIVCTTLSHRRHDHPLRDGDRLHAAQAIEYAAQVIAIHAGLRGRRHGKPGRAGLLVALRHARLLCRPLHTLEAPLTIRAHCIAAGDREAAYDAQVGCGGEMILVGRLVVIQD
ncbi:phosphotransferase [Nitrospira sp.]|nr:phosphotransferase [Nitrospira sp.]